MKIDGMVLEMDKYTQNANKVKELVLDKLLSDKVITKEQHGYYLLNQQVIIVAKSWFPKWAAKFLAKDDRDGYTYKMVSFEDKK